jgi:acetyl-CoA acetyltransferase
MKANRYLHDHGISQETLAKVAAKNFRNGGAHADDGHVIHWANSL